jgi:N-sulfoglucosamine sulfohydrolase
MAENAEKFIREKDDRPFFIYFCTADPHRARVGFANDRRYPGVKENKVSPDDVIVPHYLPDSPESREELAEYYQAVNRADQGLGRLMQALKNTGHADDTLVIYLSDNGIPFPGAKTNLYDPGMNLPLVVRSPDQKRRGVRTEAMVSWVDLVPTILEFTGAAGPDYALQGRSFLPVLEEEQPDGWNEVFGSHTFHEITMYYPMRVIRTRRYKYIRNLAHGLPYPFASDLFASKTWQGILERDASMMGARTVDAYLHRPAEELYDLQADPNEVNNLAADPDHAEVRGRLAARLKTFQQKTKDPWIVKYRYE